MCRSIILVTKKMDTFVPFGKDMNPNVYDSAFFIPDKHGSSIPTDIGTVEVCTSPPSGPHSAENINETTKAEMEIGYTFEDSFTPYISHPGKTSLHSSRCDDVDLTGRFNQKLNIDVIESEIQILNDTMLEFITCHTSDSSEDISLKCKDSDDDTLSIFHKKQNERKPNYKVELPEELNEIPKSSLLLPDIPSTRMAPRVNPTLDTQDSKGNLPRLNQLGVTQDSDNDTEDGMISQELKFPDIEEHSYNSDDKCVPDFDASLISDSPNLFHDKDTLFDEYSWILPPYHWSNILYPGDLIQKEKRTTHSTKQVAETVTSDNTSALVPVSEEIWGDIKTDTIGSENVLEDVKMRTKASTSRCEDVIPEVYEDDDLICRPTSSKTQSISSLIKTELKYKIQLERLGRGQDELKLEPESPKRYELTEDEKEKLERRRQQNRESAMRSREKFYRDRDELRKLIKVERRRQSDLMSTLANMQKEKAKYLNYLTEHVQICSCSHKKEELKEKLAQLETGQI